MYVKNNLKLNYIYVYIFIYNPEHHQKNSFAYLSLVTKTVLFFTHFTFTCPERSLFESRNPDVI